MTKLPKLPADYEKFLKTHDGETEYIFDDIDGWRFFTTEELTEVIRIDRTKVMNIRQLKAYANSVGEYVGVWLFHHDGADVERLADTFQEWLERADPDELDDDDEDEEQD